jgi:hypothetical protein
MPRVKTLGVFFMVSSFGALRAPPDRAQEGQLEGPRPLGWCRAFSPAAIVCATVSHRAIRPTSFNGDSITFSIVASSAC